jgi:UDPglucose 6-dehydrogenase
LCEAAGANVQELAKGIGLDGRIGGKFLHPGPGFGGSCFPKDTLALVRTGQEFGARSRIVEAVVDVNEARKKAMAQKVVDACDGSIAGKTIAILGVTFKPNTDDMRDSPSLAILPALQAAGAKLRAYDPIGMDEARKLLDDVSWGAGAYEILDGADAMVIITEWNEFRALDLGRVRSLMAAPVVVDLRNVYRPEEMADAGFTYVSIGRAPVRA